MLESYVSPLLMSYVNRYIKNLKTSDLQLSIWGLRLDVLEQELYCILKYGGTSGFGICHPGGLKQIIQTERSEHFPSCCIFILRKIMYCLVFNVTLVSPEYM